MATSATCSAVPVGGGTPTCTIGSANTRPRAGTTASCGSASPRRPRPGRPVRATSRVLAGQEYGLVNPLFADSLAWVADPLLLAGRQPLAPHAADPPDPEPRDRAPQLHAAGRDPLAGRRRGRRWTSASRQHVAPAGLRGARRREPEAVEGHLRDGRRRLPHEREGLPPRRHGASVRHRARRRLRHRRRGERPLPDREGRVLRHGRPRRHVLRHRGRARSGRPPAATSSRSTATGTGSRASSSRSRR